MSCAVPCPCCPPRFPVSSPTTPRQTFPCAGVQLSGLGATAEDAKTADFVIGTLGVAFVGAMAGAAAGAVASRTSSRAKGALYGAGAGAATNVLALLLVRAFAT